MPRTPLALLALAALAAVAPSAAAAHGVVAEVDQREGAVAVRVRYPGGGPLAAARYEVESPRGGDAPFAEGRTDRHGWLAFTPDVPGTWKVRIADASGHGRTVEVEVASVAAAAPDPAAAVGPPHPGPLPPRSGGRGGITVDEGGGRGGTNAEEGGDGISVPRVLAGAAAIAAVFGLAFAVQRARRGKAP